MKNILYHIKQFMQSVQNLILWFPLIWNDRQWDDDYFLMMIRKKLERMELFYRSSKAHHLYALSDAENIHKVVSVLDRILDHNYLEHAMQENGWYEKYSEYDWEIKTKPTEDPNYVEWVDTMTPEQNELFLKCGRDADNNEVNDFIFVFEFLRDHIREWWD